MEILIAASATVDSPYMVLHVIDATKHPATAIPFAHNARVVLRLVPRAVLLAREPTLAMLGTALMATEQMLPMAVVVLAQITTTAE